MQQANIPKFVRFEDKEVERYFVSIYDKDGDGKISIEEANKVLSFESALFQLNTGNYSDLRHFKNVTTLPYIGDSRGYKDRVTRIEIPEKVTFLPRYILGFAKPVIVVFHGETPPGHTWSFSYTTNNYDTLTSNGSKIYVPDNSVDAYVKAFTSNPSPLKNGSIIHSISELKK